MVKKSSKQTGSAHVVIIVILVITLVGVLSFVFWQNSVDKKTVSTATSSPSVSKKVTTPQVIDTNLATLVIPQLGIVVSYDKSLPSIEYIMQKTDLNTEYADLTSSGLIGTKCVGDNGYIASVIKNPSAKEDQRAVVSNTTIGSDIYKLALAGSNCTKNVALLSQYQTSLTNSFSMLKAK